METTGIFPSFLVLLLNLETQKRESWRKEDTWESMMRAENTRMYQEAGCSLNSSQMVNLKQYCLHGDLDSGVSDWDRAESIGVKFRIALIGSEICPDRKLNLKQSDWL